MGVTGLWSLVEPVGGASTSRRWPGKRIAVGEFVWRVRAGAHGASCLCVAPCCPGLERVGGGAPNSGADIDASLPTTPAHLQTPHIWVHQFVKAMRDERGGEPLPNAHLVGFFRRACRLLYHRVKPVFVFDGAAPALEGENDGGEAQVR